jgi:hypothetical protein
MIYLPCDQPSRAEPSTTPRIQPHIGKTEARKSYFFYASSTFSVVQIVLSSSSSRILRSSFFVHSFSNSSWYSAVPLQSSLLIWSEMPNADSRYIMGIMDVLVVIEVIQFSDDYYGELRLRRQLATMISQSQFTLRSFVFLLFDVVCVC